MRCLVGLVLVPVLSFACSDSPSSPAAREGATAEPHDQSAAVEPDRSESDEGGPSAESPRPDPPPGSTPEEGGVPPEEAAGLCEGVVGASWSDADSQALLDGVIAGFAALKRENDALIDSRGVGAYVGSNTETWKAITRGDQAAAVAIVEDHVHAGHEAASLVAGLAGTSCIGRVYRVFHDVYAALGREAEWQSIERCGRAWQSDGLHVQQALIQSGWRAPALALVTDAESLPGSADERGVHRAFLNAVAQGSYYDVPLSSSQRLQNFLPSPGSSTPRDTSTFRALSTSTYLAFATLRAGYHVPVVVPGRLVPEDLAPKEGAAAWLAARAASEPFVLESHSYREAWDKTNFEIRPLTAVLSETFDNDVTYATGTLLFAPNGTFVP